MQEVQGFPLSHELITLAGHDFSMARVADIDALFAQLLNQPSTHPDVTDTLLGGDLARRDRISGVPFPAPVPGNGKESR